MGSLVMDSYLVPNLDRKVLLPSIACRDRIVLLVGRQENCRKDTRRTRWNYN